MNSKWTDRKQNDLSAERAGVSRSSAASFFQPTICRKTVIFTLVSWAFCFRRRYWQSHFYAGSFQARDNLLRFRTLRIAWIICSSSELDGLLCKLADAGLSLDGVGHKDNDQGCDDLKTFGEELLANFASCTVQARERSWPTNDPRT